MIRGLGRGLLVCLAACSERAPQPSSPPDAAPPSPNASILPAPLGSQPSTDDPVGRPFDDKTKPGASASAPLPPPEAPRADQPFSADFVTQKEANGLSLTGEWRWLDTPAPPKVPELHGEGLSTARRLTAFRWTIELGEIGRMRVVFDSRSFPVPLGTELRARVDRLGHLLVYPKGTEYRVVPPGALRALFGDRRLDVLPMVLPKVTPKGAGITKSGRPTRRIEIATKLGVVSIDFARAPEVGQGGALLCRALVELVGGEGPAPLCAPEELPVRAHYVWPQGGGTVFELSEIPKRAELPLGDVLVPPPSARFTIWALPEPAGPFLTKEELGLLRTRATDGGAPQKSAPPEGLVAKNASTSLQYLLIDGIPMAYVLPGVELHLVGLQRGKYGVQWRSFLGDSVGPAKTLELPARTSIGEPEEPSAPAPAKSQ